MGAIICFHSIFVALGASIHFLIFSAPSAIWNAPTPNNGPASAITFLG
jgi:hypothetical protein